MTNVAQKYDLKFLVGLPATLSVYIQVFSLLSTDFICNNVIVNFLLSSLFGTSAGSSCALASNFFDIFVKMTLFLCLNFRICKIIAV